MWYPVIYALNMSRNIASICFFIIYGLGTAIYYLGKLCGSRNLLRETVLMLKKRQQGFYIRINLF